MRSLNPGFRLKKICKKLRKLNLNNLKSKSYLLQFLTLNRHCQRLNFCGRSSNHNKRSQNLKKNWQFQTWSLQISRRCSANGLKITRNAHTLVVHMLTARKNYDSQDLAPTQSHHYLLQNQCRLNNNKKSQWKNLNSTALPASKITVKSHIT